MSPAMLPGALGYFLTRFLLPGLISLLTSHGGLVRNYHGHLTPMPAGLVFTLVGLAGALFLPDDTNPAQFALVLAGFSCLGLVDDFLGSPGVRGVRGHWRALVRGELSTGLIKIWLAICLAALAVKGPPFPAVVVDALVVALAANAANLMDTRPGRAGKAFILASLPFLFAGHGPPWLALLVGAALAYLPADLRRRAMLGDTGANALGAVLGLAITTSLPVAGRQAALAVLLLLHLLAERRSLSERIAGQRLLAALDRWGRQDYD
ncbi:MAG TPA: hypothetical protein VMW83_06545 [Spirochaetia bacterium]|nr:hypothetical protein [Spirochaetia bacterium]